MVDVVFNGNVSAQVTTETVTLTVTKPDATTDVFTTNTQADGSYTATRSYNAAGTYSVTAHVDADILYKPATSAPKAFTVDLQDRTITVDVVV